MQSDGNSFGGDENNILDQKYKKQYVRFHSCPPPAIFAPGSYSYIKMTPIKSWFWHFWDDCSRLKDSQGKKCQITFCILMGGGRPVRWHFSLSPKYRLYVRFIRWENIFSQKRRPYKSSQLKNFTIHNVYHFKLLKMFTTRNLSTRIQIFTVTRPISSFLWVG